MCLIWLHNTNWQIYDFNFPEALKPADVAKGVTIVRSNQRPQIMDEVEKLLLIWIEE